MKRRADAAVILTVAILAATSGRAGGELETGFSDGAQQQLLLFPPGGGQNSTAVDLPPGIEILNATVDLEGRRALNGTAYSTTDFFLERGNLAWAGNATALPPVLPPASFEDQNITVVPGIKRSDDIRHQTTATNAAPYHMFEFLVGEANVTGFNLTWEGIGFTQPQMGFGDNGATLYLWDRLARLWMPLDTQGVPEVPVEVVLSANITVSPGRYIDVGGYITAFVAPKRIQFDNQLSTDYVKLVYWGWQTSFPENLRLDVGADGSVEWSRPGPLNATQTFSGAQFVSALQKAVDNGTGGNVSVPLRFTSSSGGLLYLTNLSIGYGPKDLPPWLVKNIPLLSTSEDVPAYAVVDLREHFDDDRGVGNLTFSLAHNTGPSHIQVLVNGTSIDIIPAEAGWYGSETARVRAADGRGQWVESNNFTVRVDRTPVVLRLATPTIPVAEQDVPYSFTFEVNYTGGGPLSFSSDSRLFALDKQTGSILFTPRNQDVGTYSFWVNVSAPEGLSDGRVYNLTVLNRNDPPVLDPIPRQSAKEDLLFEFSFTARDPDLDIGLDVLRYSTDWPRLDVSGSGLASFTPGDADVGEHRVSVTVTDSGGLSDTGVFTLTVANVNDPPALGPLGDLTVLEDSRLSLRLNATDPDLGDRLTFSSETALFTISPDGWINFTPVQSQLGVWTVKITVRDTAGATARGEFRMTVLNVNDPPAGVVILNPASGAIFSAGKAILLEAFAVDEDGDALEYSWYVDGKLLDKGQNVTTRALPAGRHALTVRVSDGNATTVSGEVRITVVKAPKPAGPDMTILAAAVMIVLAVAVAAVIAWRRSRRGA
jgi:hypothetical protein